MNIQVIRYTLIAALLVAGTFFSTPAEAQEQQLLEEFRAAHFYSQANLMAERHGLRVDYQQPRLHYSSRMDSLRILVGLPSVKPPQPEVIEAFAIADVKSFSRLERPFFESEYDDVRWTYLGVEGITGADTVLTRELRARLQDAFGHPTRILSDMAREGISADNNIQFEYWLVVNDSIPVQLMDQFGPFDRGLVLAGKVEQRELLHEVREELVRYLFEEYRREPYVDYFYDASGNQWYRAGYDGNQFFETTISRPRLQPGMRPSL